MMTESFPSKVSSKATIKDAVYEAEKSAAASAMSEPVPPEEALDDQVGPPFRPMPEGAPFLTFTGKCFCGKYGYTVQHPSPEIRRPISCNFRFCTVSGFMAM